MTDGTNFQNTTTNIIDSFTINENYGISSMKVVIPDGIYTNVKLKLMLIEENNDMSYIEHQEQICTIPCQQPMRAIGDVKDTFVKVDGVWYERHTINRYVFTGNENGIVFINNYFRYDNSVFPIGTPSSKITQSFSNYFTAESYNDIYDGVIDYGFAFDETRHRIVVRNKDISSVVELKSWLAEQYTNGTPLYVDHLIQIPLDLPCTQAQITALEALMKARTYKDVTHIYTDDEVPADLEIQYYKEKEEE